MINLENLLENLSMIDYLFLALISLIVIFSAMKGFIQSLLGMLTWIGAIFISIYLHKNFSELISNQISKFEILSKNLPVENISKYLIAIPIIFFISLFVLKKFRKFITSDLDKGLLGMLLDRLFGIIFGIFLSYIILTTILISPTLIKFNWYNNSIIEPIKNSSKILYEIEKLNLKIKPNIKQLEINE